MPDSRMQTNDKLIASSSYVYLTESDKIPVNFALIINMAMFDLWAIKLTELTAVAKNVRKYSNRASL